MSDAPCTECSDKEYRANYIEGQELDIMRERGVCFSCAFWLINVEAKGDDRYARINGISYWIGPKMTMEDSSKGHGGREFCIQFNDVRDPRSRTQTTTNLWGQGRIPAHFRKRLPDNAVFLTTASRIEAIKSQRQEAWNHGQDSSGG